LEKSRRCVKTGENKLFPFVPPLVFITAVFLFIECVEKKTTTEIHLSGRL
jgi:hypothetical protein